jgi:hypothetical protein
MTDQPCSIASKLHDIDPIGTAPTNINALLFVELPLPWHRKITKSSVFDPKIKEIVSTYNKGASSQVRIQAIKPHNKYSRKGYTRLFYYQKSKANSFEIKKLEFLLPNELIESLPNLPWKGIELMPLYEQYIESNNDTRDLFICTHEERDFCCGNYGANIYSILKEKYEQNSNGKLRIWQTSHLTGHRFAPTLLDLPEGRYWAYLDEETLEILIRRNQPASNILPKSYRGIVGMDSYSQIAEREAFLRNNWPWIGWKKTTKLLSKVNGQATVRVNYESEDKRTYGAYEITIVLDETPIHIENASCGKQKDIYGHRIIEVKELNDE